MSVRFLTSFIFLIFAVVLMTGTVHGATITVTERADSFDMGMCSLRDAVQSVNTTSDFGGCVHTGADYGTDDTIILEGGAPYIVDLPDTGSGNSNGDIDILVDLLIQGQGMDNTIVMGGFPAAQADRIFRISPSGPADVFIEGLTVSNGGSDQVLRDGAGIKVNFGGSLFLMDVLVTQNIGDEGGGIYNNDGLIQMQLSKVTDNIGFEVGGGIYNRGGMFINESTIDNNETTFRGGGIYHTGFGLLISNSTISNNRATGLPNGSDVSGAGTDGGGGGIYFLTVDTQAIITNTTISTNHANIAGGGVFVDSCCSTGQGDQVSSSGLELNGITFFNDTIVLNDVASPNGVAGGIFYNPPQIPQSLVDATGLFIEVGLTNTILALNSAETGPDCYSQIDSVFGGYNLIQDPTDCTVNNLNNQTDKTGVDPMVGPLQDNGGPTETHGLMETSPAIDMGNDVEGCAAPDPLEIIDNGNFDPFVLTRDQRNFPRPIAILDPNDPICDIGAFEFQTFGFTLTKDDGLNGQEIPVGTSFDYTIEVTNNGPGAATAVTLNDPLPAGMDFVSVTASQGACAAIGQVIGCDLGDLGVGETATIVVTVTATQSGTFTNVVTVTLNNPFQQQLTETAQETTVVIDTSVFVEGSGFLPCSLQRGSIQASPKLALALGLMVTALLLAHGILRRRAQN